MKIFKSLNRIVLIMAISAMVVSCGGNKNNDPFQQNAIGGGYTGSGNVVVNNTTDLQTQLQNRVAVDKGFLEAGGRLACEYDCPERIGSGIIGNCVRIYAADGGQVTFKTYNKNAEIWHSARDLSDIIGNERTESHMTGVVTEAMFAPYFSGTTQNIQLQRQQLQFPDMGLITIYHTPTPFGMWPFSPDIPAGANFLPNKAWCTAQQ